MGFFEKLFSPAGQNGPLSGEDRSRALIDTGLGILAQNGRPGSNVFSSLAGGVLAGREGVNAGIEARKTNAGREAIANTQLGADPEEQYSKLTALLPQLLGRGDLEGAKWVTQALNSLSPIVAAKQRAATAQAGKKMVLRNVGGSLVRVYTDENGEEQIEELYKGGPNGVTPYQDMVQEQRLFDRGDRLVKEFEDDTAPQFALANKIRGALSQLAGAKAGNGAAQIDLLYSFITALDPNSAVREGEIKLAQEAAALWSRAQMEVQKKVANKAYVIPTDLMDQMASVMTKRYELLNEGFEDRRTSMLTRAKRGKVDIEESLRRLPKLNTNMGKYFAPKGK